MKQFKVLLNSPDFQRNPIKAILKRFIWRVRWWFSSKPWVLSLRTGQEIAVPKGGAGALIYYQGFSEPETAEFILRLLKPGMLFLDIGAHIGEYTLIGAGAVSPDGQVHAFEPHPEISRLLSHNIERNNLKNVILNNCALSDFDGEAEFQIYTEPSVSSLSSKAGFNDLYKRKVLRSIIVPSMRMDTYCTRFDKEADLVKIDVEGAEMLVFLGAEMVLGLPKEAAPIWLFEYSSRNYNRFGYGPNELFELLQQYGHRIWRFSGKSQLIPFDSGSTPIATINLVAAKSEARLRPLMVSR